MNRHQTNTPPGGQRFRQNRADDPFRRLPLEGALTCRARATLALIRVAREAMTVDALARVSALSRRPLLLAIGELRRSGFLEDAGTDSAAPLTLTRDARLTMQEAA